MFNGIINFTNNIIILKYFRILNFLIFKFNKKFFEINIGDSISIEGICLTLIKKTKIYFWFDFSYGTFINVCLFDKKYYNIEKSFNIYSYLNGNFLYGHINNKIFLKNIFFYYNIIKLYLIFNILKKKIVYKTSLAINGISLTLNEIFFINNNFLLLNFNIILFSYFYTNIKNLFIYSYLNFELDFFYLYIINFLFV